MVLPDPRDGVRAEVGDLLLEGERIAAVGTLEAAPPDARIIYAGGCMVLPGFVQTHVHLCQTIFRGVADGLLEGGSLQDRLLSLEAAHTPESTRASARLAIAELLLGGTTGVQTMESVYHTQFALETLEEAGMFAVTGKCLMDDPSTCPQTLRQPTDRALQEAVDLIETWDGASGGRLRICLAPRSVLRCTDTCLREVGRLAETGGLRIHTHTAESREEMHRVLQRTGRRCLPYLQDLGCLGAHVGLAHRVSAEGSDIALLAASGSHLLHCPGTNCKLGNGLVPVPDLLRAGVAVSLGADGAACNNTLDMFREMRLAALVHKLDGGVGAIPAPAILAMATRVGAAALGREGELGELRRGAIANIVLVSIEGLHATPAPDPLSTLVYSCRSADIRAVWLAGRQVVAEGRLTLWDEEEVRAAAVREAEALFARAATGSSRPV